MNGVSGIFWGGRFGRVGCGFLLQSSRGGTGFGWSGAGIERVGLFPFGSVVGVVETGLGGVGGGALRGGCGEDLRGGAGGGTGRGVTTGAVRCGTGGGCGGGFTICGGGNCNKKNSHLFLISGLYPTF